jgi:hypothetical protein
MTKQFTLKQLFSIVDGRLATTMDDVYEILNHVCNDSLYTHHLPVAMNYLKMKAPRWLAGVEMALRNHGAGNDVPFPDAMKALEKDNLTYEIPQLQDEFNTSDFRDYMIKNSLLR